MVFGGDFCQTLPVVPKGTCQQVVATPLNISVLLPEQSQESRRTLNVVYKEVFNSIRL